jgi:hypothetical protein
LRIPDRGVCGFRCIALRRNASACFTDDNDKEKALDNGSSESEVQGAQHGYPIELSESVDWTLRECSRTGRRPNCFAIHVDQAFPLFRTPARLLPDDARQPCPSRGVD